MSEALVEGVAVLALAGLLVVAFRHPSGRVEAAAGLLAACAVLATGGVTPERALEVAGELAPVAAFLAVILVVAEMARAEGVFQAVAHGLSAATRSARSPGATFLAGGFAVAVVVTVALSLDATVVLLVPVLLAVGAGVGLSAGPAARAAIRVANSGSLLLPVANLTNLLAMPVLGLTFGGFALRMAPAWLAVLAVEYAVLRWWYRREVAAPPGEPSSEPLDVRPVFAVSVVALMLVGFAATAPWGVEPAWVAGVAAAVLVVHAAAHRRTTARAVVAAAHLPFALFVLCLGVVVDALGGGGLSGLLADVLPEPVAGVPTLGAMAVVVVVATLLANVVNNLPATLLLLPLLAPAGPGLVLAALVGLNVGSGLTYPGSLANLLWRRVLVRHGSPPDAVEFHRYSLLATPLALAAATVALWGTLHLTGG